MPEELKRAFREVTHQLNERYAKFTHKVLLGMAVGFTSCTIITGGIGWYLYNRIQSSRQDSLVQSCLDDTDQSKQNIALLEDLQVPQRVLYEAHKTFPIKNRQQCETLADERVK